MAAAFDEVFESNKGSVPDIFEVTDMPNESVPFPIKTFQPDFQNYIAIDIEHNGLPGKTCDQILEVAAIFVDDGKVIDRYYSRICLNQSV